MSRTDNRNLREHLKTAEFQWGENLIHLFIGGSELHGAKVGSTDDLDIYGVFIEPREFALGIDSCEHFIWSTAVQDRRNGPDDVDLTLYSLRKIAHLMAKGNATALHFLFAPSRELDNNVWSEQIVSHKDLFLSKAAAVHFMRFADSQLRRLQGEGTGKHGQRPEYIGAFGYDTKAAMHAIRLLNEGTELMQHSQITLPRPEPERSQLISIRTGQFGSLDRVLELSKELFYKLQSAQAASQLPEDVDRKKISELVADVYLRFYGEN
jgi:predicted nucleotidyltransferase